MATATRTTVEVTTLTLELTQAEVDYLIKRVGSDSGVESYDIYTALLYAKEV